MHRFAEAELQAWRDRPARKPLVIRGARQVGKTHLCQTFGRAHFEHVAVINFERDPLLGELFDRADPRDTVRLLEAHTRTPVLEEKAAAIKDAFQLLCLARIATPVWRTAGSGIPLGAQRDDSHFKVCLLDINLYSTLCGLDATTLVGGADPLLVNSGQLAEQFIGQELRAARPLYQEPALYYWTREQRTANAEVDYLIQHGSAVVPIEVKAGTSGQLRSLHQFLREKSRSLAVRMDASPPSFHSTHVTLPDGARMPLRLLSLPLYMCGQLRRLLDALGGSA